MKGVEGEWGLGCRDACCPADSTEPGFKKGLGMFKRLQGGLYCDAFDAGLREIMQCSAASELISRVWVSDLRGQVGFRVWGASE